MYKIEKREGREDGEWKVVDWYLKWIQNHEMRSDMKG